MQNFVSSIMTTMQLVISAGTVVTLFYTLKKFVDKPHDTLQIRVQDLEAWKQEVDRRLEKGNRHFEVLDSNSVLTQRALLAIMDSLINGNNVEELKKTRNDLYNYLAERGAM